MPLCRGNGIYIGFPQEFFIIYAAELRQKIYKEEGCAQRKAHPVYLLFYLENLEVGVAYDSVAGRDNNIFAIAPNGVVN